MDILNRIKRIFFPEVCSFCGEIVPLSQDECHCLSDAYIIGKDCCEHCGCDKDKCSCDNINAVYLDKICGVYIYGGRVRKALHRMKFRGDRKSADFFGDKMSLRVSACFPEADFDLVCAVPMHRYDKKIRGYNQSELLARRVAKRLFIPYEDCLEKTARTVRQHRLTADERNTNLIGKIALNKDSDVRGKAVLLCDDIKTTGSTLFECQNALLEGGAKEVYCLTCAVSYFDKRDSLDKRAQSK